MTSELGPNSSGGEGGRRTATEFSYGIIPLRRKRADEPLSEHNLEILLIEQKVGCRRQRTNKAGADRQWCFPKGHRDFKHEPPLDCAKRELEEETNLHITTLVVFFQPQDDEQDDDKSLGLGRGPYASEYFNPVKRRWKRCEYWAAEVEGDVRLQESEVASAQWFDSLDSAMAKVTHDEDRQILEQLKADLLLACSSSSPSSLAPS
jgi:8-oxo-dGTP pyrophosphatase MutT (NUDIX family)